MKQNHEASGPVLRPEEVARRIVQQALGRPVVEHDDGSRDRMYDLCVGDAAHPDIAIECIAAVDPKRVETWNLGPAPGAFSVSGAHDWHFVLLPGAHVKRIFQELPSLTSEINEFGSDGYVHVDAFLEITNRRLYARLTKLRISAFARYAGDGRLTFGMTGIGGWVDPTGAAVPEWIGTFLRAPEQADVLLKLKISGANERHAFVHIDFGGAPWEVESYLGSGSQVLPTAHPDLPPPLDAVWIMYGRKGLFWGGTQWRFFNALVPRSVVPLNAGPASTLPN